MGGVLIVSAITISTLLWSDLTNGFVWIVMTALIGYALIGFFDDYLMQIKKRIQSLEEELRQIGEDLTEKGVLEHPYYASDTRNSHWFYGLCQSGFLHPGGHSPV